MYFQAWTIEAQITASNVESSVPKDDPRKPKVAQKERQQANKNRMYENLSLQSYEEVVCQDRTGRGAGCILIESWSNELCTTLLHKHVPNLN